MPIEQSDRDLVALIAAILYGRVEHDEGKFSSPTAAAVKAATDLVDFATNGIPLWNHNEWLCGRRAELKDALCRPDGLFINGEGWGCGYSSQDGVIVTPIHYYRYERGEMRALCGETIHAPMVLEVEQSVSGKCDKCTRLVGLIAEGVEVL